MNPIDPSLNLNQIPQAPQYVNVRIIPQEDLDNIHHMTRGANPDDFLAKKIENLTGQSFDPKFAAKEGFNISFGFQPKGLDQDHRDVFTFVRNGQEYFGMKRYVTVDWKENGVDQRVMIAYNVEVEIKVPKQKGLSDKAFIDAMDQATYMVGIAAKMGSEPWELMMMDKVGLAEGNLKWGEFKRHNHIDKIRQDRFVTLELLSNKKSIKFDREDTFKTRNIHQVILHVRSGEIDQKGLDIDNPRLYLSTFKTDSYKNAQSGHIWGEKFARRKYRVSPEPLYPDQKEVGSAVRRYAEVQNLDEIRHELAEDRELQEILQERDLKPQMLKGSIQSQQERLQKGLNNYLYMLSDREGLQDLVDEFSNNPPNFKDNEFIETHFPTVEKQKRKVNPEIGSNLKVLSQLQNAQGLSPKAANDLQTIATSSQKAINAMKNIHEEMIKNEDLLSQLDSSISNQKDQAYREKVLNMCQDLLDQEPMELEESQEPLPEAFQGAYRLPKEAIEALEKKAKKSGKAQMELAAYYEFTNDFTKARDYYSLAADKGVKNALEKKREMNEKLLDNEI